ncbi:MAG TPA: AprI/Inh family metalloprotease inhibitor [Caulobacteraceae bacterium]|jgi:hypothetical protein|nr:AprI/Inh family metalloprotease inhibitor [Caulobacteraceae bacterium]
MRGLALTALMLFAAGAAVATVEPAAARAAGDWRLSEVGGKIACTLTFTRQSSYAGFELKAPLACRRAFPPLASVAAWAFDDKGGIVLSDARAQPIVTFPVQGAGPYEAKAPDGRMWRLEPVRSPPPSPEEAPIKTAPPIG